MLAYPIPEAEELLRSKLDAAKKSLANCEEDLEFLREQVTVCIVLSWKCAWLMEADAGGCVRARVQLGHCAAEEGEGGGRVNRGQEGRVSERMMPL
jgi:hypothetical protein